MKTYKNINTELFRRYAPKKKIEIIESLSKQEILAVTSITMKRIVKEVGQNRFHSRDKYLWLSKERQTGNDWNSWFKGVVLTKGTLYVKLYVQYENTDTDVYEKYTTFFASGEYNGEIKGADMRGNDRTYYYDYDSDDKAKALRSMLLEYVNVKYREKLNSESNE